MSGEEIEARGKAQRMLEDAYAEWERTGKEIDQEEIIREAGLGRFDGNHPWHKRWWLYIAPDNWLGGRRFFCFRIVQPVHR